MSTTLPSVRPPVPTFTSAEELIEFLRVRAGGDEFFDEGLSQFSHALQCAENLALSAPDDFELQIAGLLHDIGHLLVPDDAAGHGVHGAAAVRPLLGDRVARLIELHVPAKRYLVVTEHTYVLGLSDVSLYTLVAQGGRMTDDECEAFAQDPDSSAAVTLRRADEAAKIPGRRVRDLDSWRPILSRLSRPVAA